MVKNFNNFLRINRIDVIKFDNDSLNTDLESNTDWMLFHADLIKNMFKVLLNRNYFNIMIIDKTNAIVGILRKILKWNYSSLISEYRHHAGKNSNYFAETFLEVITIKLKSNNLHEEDWDKDFHSRKNSLDFIVMNSRRFSEDVDMEDDEDDDNLLSGSPQVPKNLLRMAELRKNRKKSEGTRDSCKESAIIDYNYYNPQYPFKGIDIIEITIPKEENLPSWFKFQRDLWETEFIDL